MRNVSYEKHKFIVMVYPDNHYIKAVDLSFAGILHEVKKSKIALQPIFEAFTNAIEAIKIKGKTQKNYKGEIVLKVLAGETTDGTEFRSLSISDNGIGFDDDEFARFNTYKLTSKGYKNLGSGRIQYVHHFETTDVISVFEKEGKLYERKFTVSKKKPFLDNNAIVKHIYCNEISEPKKLGTTVAFYSLLENSNIYNSLNEETLKSHIKERYIHYFCYNRSTLPNIRFEYYVQGELKGETSIISSDIPAIDKSNKIKLQYSKVSNDGTAIVKTDKTEEFNVDAFRIPSDTLKHNKLSLVSKGEVIEDSIIELESLSESDSIKGHKFLFLVASEFIDNRDSNIRGELRIPSAESFIKNPSLFSQEEIFLDEIQEEVNSTISLMYPEINEVREKHHEQLETLKEMFLLDDETARKIKININDSEVKILEKFYEAEAKKAADIDASIKDSIDYLDKLDTTSDNYTEELKKQVDILVSTIPQQNKKTLTHYVARRKLILDLFGKVLDKKLNVQNDGSRAKHEELIHDLLFQQSNDAPDNSDLWIINEDFIYFKGVSNTALRDVELRGKKIFKDAFSDEEERYLMSLGENRKMKKPDVLLFPEEGKCIIIEFKAPDVNASDHLTQIDKYAGLIRNFTVDEIQITTFYGYLLGESIEPRDVLGAVSSFEESYQFGYLFRPSTKVIGFDGRSNGSIYTEVIKYSTLLQRAQKRNKVFIDKLKLD